MFLHNDYFVRYHVDYIKGFLGPLRQDGDRGRASPDRNAARSGRCR